ncbi:MULTISPECIES: glycosyltransferase family 2 protein [unclassified Exiguobacterium]|uniref:glycosyltransferase family 2 protein n=1 Tax=unclassified Exiguobacterium TaxID=2644629 RepID=UPI001BE5025F|nr:MULTISPECIES: glycosyltransferase family 2 protein [unclassified Exiguobacterium]
MNNTPLISIIVPVFNVEKYITKTINSALSQTYTHIEVIVVDDGSVDNSYKKCKEISENDNRVKLIKIENSGVSNARNVGLNKAKGEYILFLDSDDIILPHLLEVCVNEINKHPHIDFVVFGMIFKFIHNNRSRSYEKVISDNFHFSFNQFPSHFKELFENNYLTSSCNKIIKAKFIKNHNLFFDEKLSFLEDFCFSLDLYKNADSIIALKEPLYVYIHRKRYSLSVKFKKNMMRMVSVIDERIKDFFKVVKVDNETHRIISAFMSHNISMCIINELNSNKNYKDKINSTKEFIEQNYVQAYLRNGHNNSVFNNTFRYLTLKKKYMLVMLICKFKQIVINSRRK